MQQTKIVATIGPSCETEEQMKALLSAGANVFRFNMKHNTVDWHRERIQRARKAAQTLGQPIGILVDLQGPEIRIQTPQDEPLTVKTDEIILLSDQFIPGEKMIVVPDRRVIGALEVGQPVLIDDGFVELTVSERTAQGVHLKTIHDATIATHKGMNLPGIALPLETLIDADLKRLSMAAEEHVEFVALSFIRTEHDVLLLRSAMQERHYTAHIIGKIENAVALKNLDSIIAASDGVMVARGDLAIEVPYEELTHWQKLIIHKSREAGKPVITATQMLQSMTESPRPTRAEVSDVANAVFDGTDAVMLSGETANGKYPVEAVTAMRRIIDYNDIHRSLPPLILPHQLTQTESITRAALTIIEAERDFPIRAIIVFSETGYTAHTLARFRPQLPLIVLTRSQTTCNQLTLTYGARPMVADFPEGQVGSIEPIIETLKEEDIIHTGERVVFIYGHLWKQSGHTNTLMIREII